MTADRNAGKTPGWFRRGLIVANTALAWSLILFILVDEREGMTATTLLEGAFWIIGGGVTIYAGSAYFDDKLRRKRKEAAE